MGNRLLVDNERCTGCVSCMLACSFAKEGTHSMEFSRIVVSRVEELADFRPMVCIQCDDKPCVHVCPVGALRVEKETGAIRVDGDLCVGCRQCIDACPHGGIQFDVERNRPLICDLCGGDPACVRVCRFPQAIRYERDGDVT